jgi:hypothetical protein
MKKH